MEKTQKRHFVGFARNFLSGPAHIRKDRKSPRRPPITIEVEYKTRVKKLIAYVSAIFIVPVFEKSVILNDFRAIAHNISAREGGNTVCSKAMARMRTVDNSVTYWFPWKHPMARLWGIEFGVLDQTPPKMGTSARPYGPRRSILFPRQNYNTNAWARPFGLRHLLQWPAIL